MNPPPPGNPTPKALDSAMNPVLPPVTPSPQPEIGQNPNAPASSTGKQLSATTSAALREVAAAIPTVPATQTAESLSVLLKQHFGPRLSLKPKMSSEYDLVSYQVKISQPTCE